MNDEVTKRLSFIERMPFADPERKDGAFVVHLVDDKYQEFRLCDGQRYLPPGEYEKTLVFCRACQTIAMKNK